MFVKKEICIFFTLSFLILINELNTAEAPGDEDNSDIYSLGIDINEDSCQITDMVLNNVDELNYFVESLIISLLSYLLHFVKLSYLFNREAESCEFPPLRSINGNVCVHSKHERKADLITEQRRYYLENYLTIADPELMNQLNQESCGIKKYYDVVTENSSKIVTVVKCLIKCLQYFMNFGLDMFLVRTSKSLISFAEEWLAVFEINSEKYKSYCRKELIKLVSSIQTLEKLNFSSNYADDRVSLVKKSQSSKLLYGGILEKYKQYLQTSKSSLTEDEFKEAKKLYENFIFCGELSEESILEVEMLILAAVDLMGLASSVVFLFDVSKLVSYYEEASDFKNRIESTIAKRMTMLNFGEQKVICVRNAARNRLKLQDHVDFDYVSKGMLEEVSKDEIIKMTKGYYSLLISAIKILNDELKNVLGCLYLRSMLEALIIILEIYTKEILNTIKVYASKSEFQIRISPFIEYSSLKRQYISRVKAKANEVAKIKRQQEVALRKQEKKEKKEREQAERDLGRKLLEEQRKEKEIEKQSKRRTKLKREYPQSNVESAKPSTSEMGSRSRSRSRSKEKSATSTPEASTSSASAKSKQSKKEKKLLKLLKEEDKSEIQAKIKEVKMEQRQTNVSEKKRKKEERKKKKDEERKREELERLEEREREKREEKERQERQQQSNYLYTLFNSVSSIEGLFEESSRQQNIGLGALISSIYSIVVETIDKFEESGDSSSSIQEVTETLEGLSISKESSAKDTGPLPPSTGGRRRAHEVPTTSGASVPTAQLFGQGATFATRSRSKSKSRKLSSTSRSRSRSRSKHRSQSSSRARSESRERSISSHKDITSSKIDGSKFLKFFSQMETSTPVQASPQGLQFFQIVDRDYSYIDENSSKDQILVALDECGKEIERLHLSVCPLLTGTDYLAAKLIEKSLISSFIKLLINLNKNKSG
ncbi:putative Secreted Protein [Cryptosporidium felis]|nr:putative Secreted Protein [Cryptosporidium felis]